MDFYGKKNLWKLFLFLFAVGIGAATLWYTESFLDELRTEEMKKIRQLGVVYENLINADVDQSLTLLEQEIIQSNNTIPIIWIDGDGNVLDSRNINTEKLSDPDWVEKKLKQMSSEAEPFEMEESNGEKQYLYYQNSTHLTKLRMYPLVLLCVISLFVIIAYIAFSNARRAEQNQVWNGLAKETAHQIGTPLTSLVGWIELLKDQPQNESMVSEMEKDVNRLNTITQRFSKIGSQPSIKEENLVEILKEAVEYLQVRSPKRIEITTEFPEESNIPIALNKHLFEWVVENLIRNAIDAIEDRKGNISIRLFNGPKTVKVEVQDSGKGVPVNKQKTIFRPGFTTKSRGWGLGLSLAKRIIEEYHDGKIFVAQSEVGKGTTFRIALKKTPAK